MKRLLVLSAVLSVSAIASTIGTCVPGTLSSYIGNACAAGDKVFENFQDSGDPGYSRINTHFQAAATGAILGPQTGTGFFTAQSFPGQIGMQANVSPVFSAAAVEQDASGQLVIANSPGQTDTPVPDTGTDDPAFFAPASSIVTTSSLTGSGGPGTANPGLSSFELAPDTVVPEPASFALIGAALLGMGLLRRRRRKEL